MWLMSWYVMRSGCLLKDPWKHCCNCTLLEVLNIAAHSGEFVRQHTKEKLTAHKSELGMCKQALQRTKEAIVNYEAALDGDEGEGKR